MPARRMPPLPEHLLAGVSGGADSVALLHLLLQRGVRVTAVHVNHGLRGEASDGDERFVRELCGHLQVPLLVYRAVPPDAPGEDWARRARYGFFREAMVATGAEALALAHHRDDQAETLLLHLLRGSGLTGLGGMAADAVVDGLRIVRPLLQFSRQELRELLLRLGQPWREDESNDDPRYLRNALRLDVLPKLEELIPGVAKRLAATAEILQGEEAVLAGMAESFLQRCGGEAYLPLYMLREQPEAMRRRIVRAWWQQQCGGENGERCLSAQQTDALARLIDAPAAAACNLPMGMQGRTGWTHLHLTGGSLQAPLEEKPLLQSELICIRPCEGTAGDGLESQALPRSLLGQLTVRSRRPGDWIRPFGAEGSQSLQDYLVNRRVDAPFRDRVPLVCRGSEVLLVGGVGAGDVPRFEEESDSVLACWTTAFPWRRN